MRRKKRPAPEVQSKDLRAHGVTEEHVREARESPNKELLASQGVPSPSRASLQRCPACGYDLRPESPALTRCPGCGADLGGATAARTFEE